MDKQIRMSASEVDLYKHIFHSKRYSVDGGRATVSE